jgi:exosortase
MSEVIGRRASPQAFHVPPHWPLLIGLAAVGIPTLVRLGQGVWTQEYGAHGPILFAASGWLLWRAKDDLARDAKPGAWSLVALGALISFAVYVFGRAYDFISLEVAGLYGIAVVTLYSYFGHRALLRNWFPILYAALIIPPPIWMLDRITSPLKEFVSLAATHGLSALGYPISREGVVLYVAQYQLLVEDACSGMNSLVGLTAISLLYIFLMRGSRLFYSAILLLFVIPITANIMRIAIVVLLTYYFGNDVGQGFAHFMAGIFLFSAALLMVFGIDHLLCRFFPERRPA